ncbi:MAG: outer membrane lipoprotein carrier protein LolA [Candidatus Delongbacteria bacterium]|nr:outer membrane lipoprotein carrier protein LolA [Candidatus Delongbacteria bacterium]
MRNFLILLLTLSLSQSAFAISGEKIISNIKDNYKKMKSFEADFTQVQIWELAAEESRVSGKIYMKNDDSFRVEMPEGDYVLSNGKTVWRYSVENKQVLIEDIKDSDDAMLPGKLFFDFADKYDLKDYFEKKDDGKTVYFLELISPKDKQRFIDRLKVKVSSDFLPYEIEYFDLDDNKTTFILDSVRINIEAAEDKFRFVKNEGTDVIDLRKKK